MDSSIKNNIKELKTCESQDIGENISNILLYIIQLLLENKKDLSDTKDGLMSHVLKEINDLSLRFDRFTEDNIRSSVPQNKRNNKNDTSDKNMGPKRNILGWIKDEYIEKEWRFFDSILVDAEKVVELILEENKEELDKKKEGSPRKRCEAALVWNIIKEIEGVKAQMYANYKEHKEMLKVKEASAKTTDDSKHNNKHKEKRDEDKYGDVNASNKDETEENKPDQSD